MIRKKLYIVFLGFTTFLLTGCWDYISLNEITIVTGIAIDYAEDQKNYHLSFEIIDITQSNKDEGIRTAILESEGSTLFDAVRKAKKRSANKLYFGDSAVIILSDQIARQENLFDIIDWYLRDAEHRENLNFIISKEKKASDLLKVKSPTDYITSYVIKEIVTEDHEVTSSTAESKAYEIYNILKEKKQELTLPAFRLTHNNNPTIEVDGMAVFNKDKLVGYIDSQKSQYVLFATNKVNGGIFTINLDEKNKEDIALEISKSSTKTSYTYENDELSFAINIDLHVLLGEDQILRTDITTKKLNEIQKKAEKKLNEEVENIIKMVQSDFNTDIFGFSNIIYRKNPKLWNKIRKDWKNIFKTVSVKVKSDITIDNTAFIK